jgi:hypothetical protein
MKNSTNTKSYWHFEENPACRAVEVTLGIVGPNVDPDIITKLFGLKPTTAWKSGETYKSKTGRSLVRSVGKWSVESSQLVKSTSVENNALALLQFLESQKEAIQNFSRDMEHRIVISFKWEATDNNYGGFSMTSETMRRLSDLCDDIHFYFIGAKRVAANAPPKGVNP